MKKIAIFGSAIAFALTLNACSDTSGTYTKTSGNDGMEYKIIGSGKGEVISYGEVMKFHFSQIYKDSLMKDTYAQPPQYQPIDSTQLPPQYIEIFNKVRKGDSIVTRILTDSVFKGGMQQMPPEFKKGEYLFTTFKVLDILPADSAQIDFARELEVYKKADSIRALTQVKVDDEALQAYFKENGITAEKTAAGTYYSISEKGGEPVKEGQTISVMYTGKLLDGTTFDSNVDPSFNHTDPFNLTIGAGGAIRGFDDGLRQFGKGTKGVLYIPSALGYGAQGSGKIKPHSNLIFEIEAVDVK